MANRPYGFGLTAELAKKKEKKFDPELASDCFKWMKFVLMDGGYEDEANTINTEISSSKQVQTALKDGILLCNIFDIIDPEYNIKINESKKAFHMMENIDNFLCACQSLGCKRIDLFQSVDLYEGQNIPQVINGIVALGRKAQTIGYDGLELGPTESTENKRNFSEQQLRASNGIIGLQAGSNKGASQAGQNFGKTRAIID